MAKFKKNSRVSLVFWSETQNRDVETPGIVLDGPYPAIPDGATKIMPSFEIITLEQSREANKHMTLAGDGLYLRRRIVGEGSWALGPRLDPSVVVPGLDDKTLDELESRLFAQQRAALSRRMQEKAAGATTQVEEGEAVPF